MSTLDPPSAATVPGDGVPPDRARETLDRLLTSEAFRNSGRLRELLRYVVERALAGDRESLKESVIGTAVFDRPATFDPREDPVVRLEARRLRFKLRDYYDAEGRADPVLIDLPKGSYAPVFLERDRGAAAPTLEARPGPRAPGSSRRRSRRVWLALATAGALAAVAAGIAATRSWWTDRARAPRGAAVAVLPFENVAGGIANEAFCFGLAEELTAELATVPGLRVVARSSAFQFHSSDGGRDLAEVGRQLGAAFVVEGSVRRQGDRLRVTAQVVALPGGHHVWARTFDRESRDVFAAQDAVAREVAAELARVIPGVGRRAASSRPPPSATAYEAYLRGRYLRSRKAVDDLRRASDAFEVATRADPSFAPAHAARAEVLATLGFHGHEPASEVIPQAEAAVAAALALDPDLSEAHATRAWIQFFHDWDWPAAEWSFRRALALNPNLAGTHNLFGLALLSRRRSDEALDHIRLARELDPLTYAASNELGLALLSMGRLDDVLSHARRTLEIHPSFYAAHAVAGLAHVAAGRHAEAASAYEAGLAAGQRHAFLVAGLAHSLGRLGRQDEARRLVSEVGAACAEGVGCLWLAVAREGLDDHAGAMAALDRAVEARDPDLLFLDINPMLARLAGRPEFEALRRRVGLEAAPAGAR